MRLVGVPRACGVQVQYAKKGDAALEAGEHAYTCRRMYDPIQQIWSSLPPSVRKRPPAPVAEPPRVEPSCGKRSAAKPAIPVEASAASRTPSAKNGLPKVNGRKGVAAAAPQSSARVAAGSDHCEGSGAAPDGAGPPGRCERAALVADRSGQRPLRSATRTDVRALGCEVDSGGEDLARVEVRERERRLPPAFIDAQPLVRSALTFNHPGTVYASTPRRPLPQSPLQIPTGSVAYGQCSNAPGRLAGLAARRCGSRAERARPVPAGPVPGAAAAPIVPGQAGECATRSYHIGVAENGGMASTVCSHGVVRTWDLASGERLSEPLKDAMCAAHRVASRRVASHQRNTWSGAHGCMCSVPSGRPRRCRQPRVSSG